MGAQGFLCNRIRTTLQNERSQAMLSLFSDQAILVDFPNDIIEANHNWMHIFHTVPQKSIHTHGNFSWALANFKWQKMYNGVH